MQDVFYFKVRFLKIFVVVVCSDYTQIGKFLLCFTVSSGYRSLEHSIKEVFFENRASVLEKVPH